LSFIFVALVGDEASADAMRFARRLAALLGAHAFVAAESPSKEEIAKLVREAPLPAHVLIFGHDGGAFRARTREDPLVKDWATANEIAQMCPNLSIYAFSCDTMGSKHVEEVEALGHGCVAAGVASFLGHSCVVSASIADDPDAIVTSFAAMLRAYFSGERDIDVLRQALEDEFDALDELATNGIGAFFSVPWVLRSAVRGLCIAVA